MSERVEILFKGIKRKIKEDQYSKLKQFPYHQMMSPRPNQNETVLIKQISKSQDETAQQLEQYICELELRIREMRGQNQRLNNQLKKQQKIVRIMPKISKVTGGDGPETTFKDLTKYREFLLALTVIQLQQEYQKKSDIFNCLAVKSKKGRQTQHNELMECQASLLANLFTVENRQEMDNKVVKTTKNLNKKLELVKSNSNQISAQLRNLKKQKQKLSNANWEINSLIKEIKNEIIKAETKKNHRDPSQFISTKSGQMKNVSELETEIQQLRSLNQTKSSQIQAIMEAKILQKITLRNQIQKYMNLKFHANDYMEQSDH